MIVRASYRSIVKQRKNLESKKFVTVLETVIIKEGFLTPLIVFRGKRMHLYVIDQAPFCKFSS